MNKWLLDHLVCPRDKMSLELSDNKLACASGHTYPVFDDIPVMLVDDVEETHAYISKTLEKVAQEAATSNATNPGDGIDEFVQGEIPYTSGNLYFSVQYKLKRYPIPEIRLVPGGGRRLLDVGCNWGRWTVAAARKGYRAIGIDPSIDAVMAARRVAKQMDVEADFLVGDARFLPFADDSFDTVFCYSVLQHFSKENARISLTEMARVLRKDGVSLIQMPNRNGIRQYQQHRRRGFTEGEGFEVRYWTPPELMNTFTKTFGATNMTVDCYFGLGIQASDIDLLPFRYRVVVWSSELLRRMSTIFKPLTKVADSVYLESVNQNKP
jgi:SAM-dependent methyltransferase